MELIVGLPTVIEELAAQLIQDLEEYLRRTVEVDKAAARLKVPSK
jgi:hypothetical protein